MTGMDYGRCRGADAIVNFDADGQHDPADIPKSVGALADHDLALGSVHRHRRGRYAARGDPPARGRHDVEPHGGPAAHRRALRPARLPRDRDPALRITQDRMAHASELLRKIQASGLPFVEVPITVRYTEHSTAKGQTGFQAIRILFDYFFRAS